MTGQLLAVVVNLFSGLERARSSRLPPSESFRAEWPVTNKRDRTTVSSSALWSPRAIVRLFPCPHPALTSLWHTGPRQAFVYHDEGVACARPCVPTSVKWRRGRQLKPLSKPGLAQELSPPK